MRLSIVINTLNEEKNLPRVLASIDGLADEIVVVDMKSDDKTVEIAEKGGAKVYGHERTNYVEPARNFAIAKTTGEWILILDADEELTRELKTKIRSLVNDTDYDYFRIPRKNMVFGKWLKHSRWWPDYNIRLFRKGCVVWNEVIHSVPMTTGVGFDLEEKEAYAIIHNHYISIEQYVSRLNRYTTQHALLLIKAGYKFDWRDVLIKPPGEFFSRYFFGKGYKDGLHGLAVCLLQGFSELVLYLKVWEIQDKFEERQPPLKLVISTMDQVSKDLNYWKSDALFSERGGIINRIKRKLKLP